LVSTKKLHNRKELPPISTLRLRHYGRNRLGIEAGEDEHLLLAQHELMENAMKAGAPGEPNAMLEGAERFGREQSL
jgi:hypothetical protein